MKIATVNQVIINPKEGHSWFGTCRGFMFNAAFEKEINALYKTHESNKNGYFVYEIIGDEIIMRAAQPKAESAIKYYQEGRIIAHFDKLFI